MEKNLFRRSFIASSLSKIREPIQQLYGIQQNNMKVLIATFLVCFGTAVAFSPAQPQPQQVRATTTALAASPSHVAAARQIGASFLAAATIFSSVLTVQPPIALAAAFDAGSSQVLAARSGGRAGGRAPARAAPTRVIERQTTTVIQQTPSVYMAPSPMYYSPQPSGLGLALGLNAVSGISEGFREARQENEIRSTRDQLTESRIKEAQMEARLRQLEMQQMAAR